MKKQVFTVMVGLIEPFQKASEYQIPASDFVEARRKIANAIVRALDELVEVENDGVDVQFETEVE